MSRRAQMISNSFESYAKYSQDILTSSGQNDLWQLHLVEGMSYYLSNVHSEINIIRAYRRDALQLSIPS
eukprot:scaffold312210_cov14-Prasinocladus_malaysianus.AAC.1